MIFWIFVILTVVGIAVIVATNVIGSSGGNKVQEFLYYNDEHFVFTGATVAAISGLVAVIMLVVIIIVQASADGLRASNEQRYNALVYKAQTEAIRDEFGIVNKEYIDEVQAWNEDLAKYQSYSHNFWIGIFYPKRVYDGFEIIDLQSIRMKD